MDDIKKLLNEIRDDDLRHFLIEYTKNGFGYLSKHDIDLLVWSIITKILNQLKDKNTYELA